MYSCHFLMYLYKQFPFTLWGCVVGIVTGFRYFDSWSVQMIVAFQLKCFSCFYHFFKIGQKFAL